MAKKVYICLACETWEAPRIESVFSSKIKAEKFATEWNESQKKRRLKNREYIDIEEHELK